jgi:hypothetical protein
MKYQMWTVLFRQSVKFRYATVGGRPTTHFGEWFPIKKRMGHVALICLQFQCPKLVNESALGTTPTFRTDAFSCQTVTVWYTGVDAETVGDRDQGI